MRLPRRARRRGFTLIEVLIALTIVATAMSIVWGSFANSNRMREFATAKYDRLRSVQAAMQRMRREISMAFVTKIGQIPTNEDNEETYITAFMGQSDRLDFSSFAHVRTRVDEVSSEQAEISYYLRSNRTDDGQLRQDLVRREQAPIDGDPERGGRIYTLLEGVEDLTFEYWNPEREIAGDAWETEWDTTDTLVNQLPTRVRITVDIDNPVDDRDELEFATQAEIHLLTPIGFVTTVLTQDQLDETDFEAQAEENIRQDEQQNRRNER